MIFLNQIYHYFLNFTFKIQDRSKKQHYNNIKMKVAVAEDQVVEDDGRFQDDEVGLIC